MLGTPEDGGIPVRQSLARPVLIGGCERVPLFINWFWAICLACLSGLYPPALLLALLLMTGGTWLLRQAALLHPRISLVYWRALWQPRVLRPARSLWESPPRVLPGIHERTSRMPFRAVFTHPHTLADRLPYGFLLAHLDPEDLVSQAGVLCKEGSLVAGAVLIGRDVESSSDAELAAYAQHINRTLAQYGDGWMAHTVAFRRESQGYMPPGHFPDPVTARIDQERREQYEAAGTHYESVSVLVLTYTPPRERESRFLHFLTGTPTPLIQEEQLTVFRQRVVALQGMLSTAMGVFPMDAPTLVSFLHTCITGIDQQVRLPEEAVFLDRFLASQDIHNEDPLQIGDSYTQVLNIAQLPFTSVPALLDWLNTLATPYRLTTRFILMDALTAKKEMERHMTWWLQLRFGSWRNVLGRFPRHRPKDTEEIEYLDENAFDMAADVAAARTEVNKSVYGFGLATTTLLFWHRDRQRLAALTDEVIKRFQQNEILVRRETTNNLEAYLGSLPGDAYHDVSELMLNTLNIAHLGAWTSTWTGAEVNPSPMFPPQSPPLLYASSPRAPLRLHLHVSDVGHFKMTGPIGAGKSTAIALLCAQWFRFKDAKVILFDMKRSAFALAMAAGAHYYDTGHAQFSGMPLARVDDPHERTWAGQWLERMLRLQGVEVTSTERNDINRALEVLGQSRHRTLTNFVNIVQNRKVKEGLRIYQVSGYLGHILDGDHESFTHGHHFYVFEQEALSRMDKAFAVPIWDYHFHLVESVFDGSPGLLIADEAALLFLKEMNGPQLEKWLLEKRKDNVAVGLAVQSPGHIVDHPLASTIIGNTPTTICLPDATALNSKTFAHYEALGFSSYQIDMVARGVPKQDYFLRTDGGQFRALQLGLGPVAMAYCGSSSIEERQRIAALIEAYPEDWTERWEQEKVQRMTRHAVTVSTQGWTNGHTTEEKTHA